MKYLFLLLLPVTLGLVTREPVPPPASSRNTPEERWLMVPLNNFHGDSTEVFPMRYYYNSEYAGQHMVIFVGGEWGISPGWTQGGLAYELARLIGAGVFYTEHRYYGLSAVGNETSLEQMRFLNVDQALGDLAHFIRAVKSPDYEFGRFQHGSVILVGCSYAGSMATWMRLAYPHLVDAAFSDSGPLHAQEDFPEYLEIITEALRQQGGQACLSAVEESMEALEALLQTPTGPGTVSDWFNTCTPLTTAPLDLATFHWFGVTESFAYLVQYATPGAIPTACAALTNTSIADPVQRLASWVRAQPLSQPCVEASYSKVVMEHTDTDYSSPKATMRLWTYQTCTEYGWYQTTSSSRQPFLSTVPLEYFHQMCKDFFSTQLDEPFLRRGIERTNLFFGGLTHMPDHVVSVAGGHDPWSPMGPNATHATPKSPVYVVPNVSHCRAISGTGSSDTEELQRVKWEVLYFLYEKATGQPLLASHASASVASMTLLAGVLALVL